MSFLSEYLAVPVVLLVLAGCAGIPPDATLYQRLGGEAVLKAVVDETIDSVAADPRTRRSFQGIKLVTVKQSIVSQLCVVSKGPCKYEGETMQNAHRDAKITDAEFDLMVATLRESLDRHVGTREKNELLKLLAPMKRDIVSAP